MVVTPASTAEDRTAWHELRQHWKAPQMPRVTVAAPTVTPVVVRAQNERLPLDHRIASPQYHTPGRLSWQADLSTAGSVAESDPGSASGSTPGGAASLEAQRRRELAQVFVQFLPSPDFNLSPAESFRHCPHVTHAPSRTELETGRLMYHQLINGLAFMRFFEDSSSLCPQDVDTAQRIWNAMSTRKDGYVYWDDFGDVLVALFDPLPPHEAAALKSKNDGVRVKLQHYYERRVPARQGQARVGGGRGYPRVPPQAPQQRQSVTTSDTSVFDSPTTTAHSSATGSLLAPHIKSPEQPEAEGSIFRTEADGDSGTAGVFALAMQHRSVSYATDVPDARPSQQPEPRLGNAAQAPGQLGQQQQQQQQQQQHRQPPATPPPHTAPVQRALEGEARAPEVRARSPLLEEAWLRHSQAEGQKTPPRKQHGKDSEPWYMQSWRSPVRPPSREQQQQQQQETTPRGAGTGMGTGFATPVPFSPDRFLQIDKIHSQLDCFREGLLGTNWNTQKDQVSPPLSQLRDDPATSKPPQQQHQQQQQQQQQQQDPALKSPESAQAYAKKVEAATSPRPVSPPLSPSRAQQMSEMKAQLNMLQEQIATRGAAAGGGSGGAEAPRRKSSLKSVSILEQPVQAEDTPQGTRWALRDELMRRAGNSGTPAPAQREGLQGHVQGGSRSPRVSPRREAAGTADDATTTSSYSADPPSTAPINNQWNRHRESMLEGPEDTPVKSILRSPISTRSTVSSPQNSQGGAGNSVAIVGKDGIEFVSPHGSTTHSAPPRSTSIDRAEARLRQEKEDFQREKRDWESKKTEWEERLKRRADAEPSAADDDSSVPPPAHLQPQLKPLRQQQQQQQQDRKVIKTPGPDVQEEWRQAFPQDEGWLAHDGQGGAGAAANTNAGTANVPSAKPSQKPPSPHSTARQDGRGREAQRERPPQRAQSRRRSVSSTSSASSSSSSRGRRRHRSHTARSRSRSQPAKKRYPPSSLSSSRSSSSRTPPRKKGVATRGWVQRDVPRPQELQAAHPPHERQNIKTDRAAYRSHSAHAPSRHPVVHQDGYARGSVPASTMSPGPTPSTAPAPTPPAPASLTAPEPVQRSVHAPMRRVSSGSNAHHESRVVTGGSSVAAERLLSHRPQRSEVRPAGNEGDAASAALPVLSPSSQHQRTPTYEAQADRDIQRHGDQGMAPVRLLPSLTSASHDTTDDSSQRGRRVGPGGAVARRQHSSRSAPAPPARGNMSLPSSAASFGKKERQGSGGVHGKPDPLPVPSLRRQASSGAGAEGRQQQLHQQQPHQPVAPASSSNWHLRNVESASSIETSSVLEKESHPAVPNLSSRGRHTPTSEGQQVGRLHSSGIPPQAPARDADGWIEKGANATTADSFFEIPPASTYGSSVKTSFPPPGSRPSQPLSAHSSSARQPPVTMTKTLSKSNISPSSCPAGFKAPPASSPRAQPGSGRTTPLPAADNASSSIDGALPLVSTAGPPVKVLPPAPSGGPGTPRASLYERRQERLSARLSTGSQGLKEKWDSLSGNTRQAVLPAAQSAGGSPQRQGRAEESTTGYSERGRRHTAHDLRHAVWKAEAERRLLAAAAGSEVTVHLGEVGERLGITFEQHTVLSSAQEGLPGARAGMGEYIGRRVTHVNGVATRTLRDIKAACEGQLLITFRFAPSVEQPSLLSQRDNM